MGPGCPPPWRPDGIDCPETPFPEKLAPTTPATGTPATPAMLEGFFLSGDSGCMPETLTTPSLGTREVLLLEIPSPAALHTSDNATLESCTPTSPRSVESPQDLMSPRSLGSPRDLLSPWSLCSPQALSIPDSLASPESLDSPRDLHSRRTKRFDSAISMTHVSTTTGVSSMPRHFSPTRVDSPQPGPENSGLLRVVTLNLGGRNTNPLEFELKGDNSETAMEAASLLRKARKALSHVDEGPSSMLPTEREILEEIMAEIYGGGGGEAAAEGEAPAPLQNFVQGLLHCETWSIVLSRIRVKCPDLFNALNLATLQLKRPSVWEDPASCRSFSNTREYLLAWKEWYCGLDRSSPFWLEDAPRSAKKRNLDTATAFAGLLLFDTLCLFSARASIPSGIEDESIPEEEGREVPFKQIAGLAAKLPSASLTARHSVAEMMMKGAHVLFAQEARDFAICPTMAEDFLAPFCARDNFTCVFLRKDAFADVSDITSDVAKRMEHMVDRAASGRKAWRTSVSRLAAVWCRCHPQSGGFTACLVSMHCSKSDFTAAFMEALREVLQDYTVDINIAGLDSNCSAKDAQDFQERLRSAGFDVGCSRTQNQVTVAKRRTTFQTQIRKIGETDISHKDYIVSWSPQKICRAATTYTPDLRTAYGVEQETKQCVRLPTTQWPFDHCSVATSFQREPSRREVALGMLFRRRTLWTCCMVCFILEMLLLPPLASPQRRSMYGPAGTWQTDNWAGTPRVGICEAAPPCPEGWLQSGGSCYRTTPKVGYEEAADLCHNFNGEMVAIGSEAENQFITETVCPKGDLCWIGLLSDNARENTWWGSGEQVTYTRLESYADFIFPLHALSHGTDYQATILSNQPSELEGCAWDYAFTLMTRPPTAEALVEVLAPAAAMTVSAGIMLFLRSPQLLTLVYFASALMANILWYIPRMWRVCFATNIGQYRFLENIGNLCDEGMHSVTSFMAIWIIIRRMSVLQPARHLKIGFWLLLGSSGAMVICGALFVDTTTTLAVESITTTATGCAKFLSVMIIPCLGIMMSRDLYRAWRLIQREATSGKSGQVSTYLADGIRGAKYLFYSVMAATMTATARCGAFLALFIGMYYTVYPRWARTVWTLSTLLDSVTNDLCAYILASTNMDGAILRAKGITNEVMERATMEVDQHRLAVHVLKAAPTSTQQLKHLGDLESRARKAVDNAQEDRSFLILQSAVRVETARIHHLMLCVRLRAMTMPVRYQYLIDIPVLEAAPRQYVPEEFTAGKSAIVAGQYFCWLYEQAAKAREVLFHQVNQLLAKFSSTPWPSDLGLASEQFPWTIWASGAVGIESRKLLKGERISPGDILIHACNPTGRRLQRDSCTYCVVLEDTGRSRVRIHRSGAELAEEVPREDLRICNSGGVFIPGPLKKKQRCLDKIVTDYEDVVEWPPAASLTDIARCAIVLDDPYAMAVLVGFIQANMKVVRIKNRFCEDLLEPLTPEALQAMFNHVADHDSETRTNGGGSTEPSSSLTASIDQQYRDININVEVSVNGVPFVCEIQVTLSNLAILKHADQQLYSIRRMKSARELLRSYVFSNVELAGECLV